MKLQNFMVIFVIVLLPIILVTAYYMSLQIDTINMQTSYSSKLQQSTRSAIEAYEINTVKWNSTYSRTPDSQRRDIIASINTFTTSFANNMGVSGTNKETVLGYVPAIAYTLYDGYYIYSPAVEKETIVDDNEVTVTMRENLTEGVSPKVTGISGDYTFKKEDEGKILYEVADEFTGDGMYLNSNGTTTSFTLDQTKAKGSNYKHILKPFSTYSQTYYYDGSSTEKVVVNYTLDNYIKVYGQVPKTGGGYEYTYKEGYLTSKVCDLTSGTIKDIYYKADDTNKVEITPEELKEYIYYEGIPGNKAQEYNYVYTYDKIKIYVDNDASNTCFYLDGTKRVNIGDGYSNYYKKCTVPLKDGEEHTYLELYQNLNTKEWKIKRRNKDLKEENLDSITNENTLKKYLNTTNLDRTILLDYSAVNYCVESKIFTQWFGNILSKTLRYDNGELKGKKVTFDLTDPEDITQSFDQERRRVIKETLKTNLEQAITSYSNNSPNDYNLPVLTETDWDQILTNVSIITFAQNIPIGMKYFNSYSIATSTTNDEYVDPNQIYLCSTSDEFYHNPYCSKLKPGEIQGYRNTDFVEKSFEKTVSGITKTNYYYPHAHSNDTIQSCYYCMIQKDLYEKAGNVGSSTSTDLKTQQTVYCRALSRERYVAKKTKLPLQIAPQYVISIKAIDDKNKKIESDFKFKYIFNGSESEKTATGGKRDLILPLVVGEPKSYKIVGVSDTPAGGITPVAPTGSFASPEEASSTNPGLTRTVYTTNSKITVDTYFDNYNFTATFSDRTNTNCAVFPDGHKINDGEPYNNSGNTLTSDVLNGYINVQLKYTKNYTKEDTALPVFANIDKKDQLTIVTNLKGITGDIQLVFDVGGKNYYSKALHISNANTIVYYYISGSTKWYNGDCTVKVRNMNSEQIGSGTVGFYTIDDSTGLKGFATATNEGAKTEGRKFYIINNITDVGSMKPICSSHAFKGTISGGNVIYNNPAGTIKATKTTRNITKVTIDGTGITENAGLFGQIDKGTVENLTIDTIGVNLETIDYVGGLAGKNNKGTINNITIKNPTIKGKNYVGGFFGKNSGNITGCKMEQGTGSGVTGHFYVGGFVGSNDGGSLSGLTNEAKVSGIKNIGGLAGVNNASITDGTNNGEIIGSFEIVKEGSDDVVYAGNVGGIVGKQSSNTLSGCKNTGEISGYSDAEIDNGKAAGAGGIVGYIKNATITECGNYSKVLSSETIGGIAGVAIDTTINYSLNRGILTNAGRLNYGGVGTQFYHNQIGGICGRTDGCEINCCYNVGNIEGANYSYDPIADALLPGGVLAVAKYDDFSCTGGIVALIEGTTKINNCYNAGQITGGNEISWRMGIDPCIGGIVGSCKSDKYELATGTGNFYINGNHINYSAQSYLISPTRPVEKEAINGQSKTGFTGISELKLRFKLYNWATLANGAGGLFKGSNYIYYTTAPINETLGAKGYGVLYWEISGYSRRTIYVCDNKGKAINEPTLYIDNKPVRLYDENNTVTYNGTNATYVGKNIHGYTLMLNNNYDCYATATGYASQSNHENSATNGILLNLGERKNFSIALESNDENGYSEKFGDRLIYIPEGDYYIIAVGGRTVLDQQHLDLENQVEVQVQQLLENSIYQMEIIMFKLDMLDSYIILVVQSKTMEEEIHI